MFCIFCGGNGYYVSESLSGNLIEHDCPMCDNPNPQEELGDDGE